MAAENSFDVACKFDMQDEEKQVRVSGKNRDDLQSVIALLKAKDLGIALQYINDRST